MVTFNDGGVLKQSHRRLSVITAVFAVLAVPLLGKTAFAFPGVNGRIGYVGGFPNGPIESVLPDGSSPKTISNAASVSFRFSADGTRLAYGTLTPTVNVRNYDGTGDAVLNSGDSGLSNPTWSPTNDKVLFTRTNSTYVLSTINPDGTGRADITSAYSIEADWSPDGSKVVFLGWDGDTEIYTANADGTGLTKLTTDSTYEWQPRWSPDGSKILYRNTSGPTFQIYTMNANGSSVTQLTSSSDHNYSPAWSPDGTKIAFTRLTGGHYDIYTMNTNGSSQTAILTGEDYVESIDWQPLTVHPTPSTPNPTITVSNSTATVNIPSLYTDSYDGINNASVSVTSTPSSGSTSVNSTTGVITYTQASTASRSFFSNIGSLFFPAVSAAGTTDSFTYQVCSSSSSSLCSTGTVTVALTSSSGTLANTGQNAQLITLFSLTLLLSSGAILLLKSRRRS